MFVVIGYNYKFGNTHLFLDNFFVNTKLGKVLYRLGVGVSDTAAAKSGFSKNLLALRDCTKKSTYWGQMAIHAVCREVLCLAWVDSNVVQFMTTAHSIDYILNDSRCFAIRYLGLGRHIPHKV